MYNEIKPISVSGYGVTVLSDLFYEYKLKDFPSLFRRIPGYDENPILEIKIVAIAGIESEGIDSEIICTTSFGWPNGAKHLLEESPVIQSEWNDRYSDEVAGYIARDLEDEFPDVISKMVDEAMGCYTAHAVGYNSENNFERWMYEKYFGKDFNVKPQLLYTFKPNVENLGDYGEYAQELNQYIVPVVELRLQPTNEPDEYIVYCYCTAENSDRRHLYRIFKEKIPYLEFAAHMKDIVEYACRNYDWTFAIYDKLQDVPTEDYSYDLQYLIKTNIESYYHDYSDDYEGEEYYDDEEDEELPGDDDFLVWDGWLYLDDEELRLSTFCLFFDFGDGQEQYWPDEILNMEKSFDDIQAALQRILCAYDDGQQKYLCCIDIQDGAIGYTFLKPHEEEPAEVEDSDIIAANAYAIVQNALAYNFD